MFPYATTDYGYWNSNVTGQWAQKRTGVKPGTALSRRAYTMINDPLCALQGHNQMSPRLVWLAHPVQNLCGWFSTGKSQTEASSLPKAPE